MTARIAPIPFAVERQSPMIDGGGVPWIAFQAERGDQAKTKYCRLEKRTAVGWEHVPCPDAEAIYDQPMWAFHVDGTAVIIGMDRLKKQWIVADVPEFKPGISLKDFRDLQQTVLTLATALAALKLAVEAKG